MSLYINFEPHSYYKGFAIKKDVMLDGNYWFGFTDDGIKTYGVVQYDANTLKELKQLITGYRSK